MSGHTVKLFGAASRTEAKRIIDAAPMGYVMTVKEPVRTQEQNDKMHAMLSDISRAKPMGWSKKPDSWKCILMRALGHEIQMEQGLDGEPFPMGYRSSRLSVKEMSDLIEFMYAFGAEHNVKWTDEKDEKTA